ncbi:CehA/McbA family metallohydrolase [Roseovarius salis]|uniref:PHP domain-containing protein n=1 Tax=Roseovarius salis TaxID=3376063 RepID=UPI0037C68920
MTSAFTAPGRFYRGNLHTHSTLSDGRLTPDEVCRRYRAAGYDFIALTDHFVGLFGYPVADTTPYRTGNFTTLLGAELHSGPLLNGDIWHILAVGLPADFAPANAPDFAPADGQESGPDIARRARDAGAFVAVAHPHWSGLTLDDAMSLDAAHAVEIYNHGCAVDAARGDGFHTAELMLSAGRKLSLVATDDAHFASDDAFGGWVMVKAEENAPGPLLEALKAGAFYATQGPELRDIRFDGDQIVVESSSVERVIVQGHASAAQCRKSPAMTEARLGLAPFANSPWIRVTAMDAAGRMAWSNPIWRD